MAMASPPPMHSVARPRFTSFSFMECNSVTTIRLPEQPIGWPKATAPPQMLKISQGMPSSFLTPTLAEENASLCSTRSNFIELHSGPLHQLPYAGDRCEHHFLRFHSLRAEVSDRPQRVDANLARLALAHQHRRARAIGNLG